MATAQPRQARQPGQGGPRSRPLLLCLCVACLAFPAGCCALGRHNVDREIMAGYHSPEHAREVAAAYRIGCPDVLDLTVPGTPPMSARCGVDPAGEIDLGPGGQVRVEG